MPFSVEQIGNRGVLLGGHPGDSTMLVTMKNSELIDKLVVIADGNIDLVQEAIRACAKGSDGAELKDVVEYIRKRVAAPAAA